MNVFVYRINIDYFCLFKTELILDIVEEMGLNDFNKEEIINEIIDLLDDYDYI